MFEALFVLHTGRDQVFVALLRNLYGKILVKPIDGRGNLLLKGMSFSQYSCLYSLVALLAAAALLAVNNVNAQKETRDVPIFTAVSFGISGNLYIKQGAQQSLVIEGDDLDEIETDVSSGKLRIRQKGNGWSWRMSSKRRNVYITITKLEGLNLSGSGKVIGDGTFKTDDLDLGVSGSGDIDLRVIARSIDTGISGSGDIELSGTAGKHKVSISGSGRLDAEELKTETYKIRISGSGTCRINVSKEIDSSVSGSGSIYYKGNPDKVYNHSSGSGKIRKI